VPYRTFTSESGARILVGRSARDNDELLRSARGNDLWLHARAVQGSHVIVPDPGAAPDPRTLRDAALLAAHFSGARSSEGVEVAWTRRKHVRKLKGAAPGAVTFSQDRTVRVRRDDAVLRALLASEEAAV
jgi:predicted ribosome quality control (RQC) complex YloA/Tae2 family protein